MAHTDMSIWQTAPIMRCLPERVAYRNASATSWHRPRIDVVNTLVLEVDDADTISQS